MLKVHMHRTRHKISELAGWSEWSKWEEGVGQTDDPAFEIEIDNRVFFTGPVTWRPIAEADKDIAYIHDLGELRIGGSYPIWVRDEDGRVYEALWSDDGKRAYWWDIEGESPVDPVEFMPHPLDPRWIDAERCPTCDGTGMEARHQLCRDCDDTPTNVAKGGAE